MAVGLLVALAALAGLTQTRTAMRWFKVCPVLLTACAAQPILASVT